MVGGIGTRTDDSFTRICGPIVLVGNKSNPPTPYTKNESQNKAPLYGDMGAGRKLHGEKLQSSCKLLLLDVWQSKKVAQGEDKKGEDGIG